MAWKKSTSKHSQTFSCAKFDFMDMLLEHCETKAHQTLRFSRLSVIGGIVAAESFRVWKKSALSREKELAQRLFALIG
jgi:hypothetical protein